MSDQSLSEAAEPTPPRRRGAWGCLLRGVLAIVVVIAVIIASHVISGDIGGRRARNESIAVLRAAATPEDFDAAVGRLGVMLRVGANDWIAIRYRDSHNLQQWYSSSVARCSDGTWFTAWYHYCGLFGGYRFTLEGMTEDKGRERALAYLAAENNRTAFLAKIESAATLDEAKTHLRALGFREMSPPR
jgi:hypothetical protein